MCFCSVRALAVVALFPFVALAAEVAATDAELPAVQVTATRTPEPADRVPASVTVISGDELRARGAIDLRTAVSFTAGVEFAPSGDRGQIGRAHV